MGVRLRDTEAEVPDGARATRRRQELGDRDWVCGVKVDADSNTFLRES